MRGLAVVVGILLVGYGIYLPGLFPGVFLCGAGGYLIGSNIMN